MEATVKTGNDLLDRGLPSIAVELLFISPFVKEISLKERNENDLSISIKMPYKYSKDGKLCESTLSTTLKTQVSFPESGSTIELKNAKEALPHWEPEFPSTFTFQSSTNADGESILSSFLSEIYKMIEHTLFPEKEMIIRDFAYPLNDPRHWGRKAIEISESGVDARVIVSREAESDRELSILKNDVVVVVEQRPNGWVLARPSNSFETGIIPENCIEYIAE